MPNLYEKVLAIPDQAPAQLAGPLPAASVAGYAPPIPAGQMVLIPTGPNAGVWMIQSGAWTKETHAPGISVQVKVTQGDLAGWWVQQPSAASFVRL